MFLVIRWNNLDLDILVKVIKSVPKNTLVSESEPGGKIASIWKQLNLYLSKLNNLSKQVKLSLDEHPSTKANQLELLGKSSPVY